MGFAQNFTSSLPSSSFGYYRGVVEWGGSGGQTHGPGGSGPTVAGNNAFAQGQGPASGATTGWEPSIMYLLVFVFLEMIVFGILARHL